MLKTIYSKYLVSFIALIGIGFLAIAIIICSVVTNYSINTKTELMNKTAEMVYLEVSNEMKAEGCDFETAIMNNNEKYKNVFFLNGHLHGGSHSLALEGLWDDIEYRLISADKLNFCPFTVIP